MLVIYFVSLNHFLGMLKMKLLFPALCVSTSKPKYFLGEVFSSTHFLHFLRVRVGCISKKKIWASIEKLTNSEWTFLVKDADLSEGFCNSCKVEAHYCNIFRPSFHVTGFSRPLGMPHEGNINTFHFSNFCQVY